MTLQNEDGSTLSAVKSQQESSAPGMQAEPMDADGPGMRGLYYCVTPGNMCFCASFLSIGLTCACYRNSPQHICAAAGSVLDGMIFL